VFGVVSLSQSICPIAVDLRDIPGPDRNATARVLKDGDLAFTASAFGPNSVFRDFQVLPAFLRVHSATRGSKYISTGCVFWTAYFGPQALTFIYQIWDETDMCAPSFCRGPLRAFWVPVS